MDPAVQILPRRRLRLPDQPRRLRPADQRFGLHHVAAAVGAFTVAVTNNFLWNRYWTFGPGDGPAHFQAARFFTVSLASLGLNIAVLEILLSTGSTGELTAQAIAVAAAMPFNFIGNKLWTFS